MIPVANLSLSGINRIALAATIWGSIGVFARAIDAHPAVIVFWRILFAAVAIAAVSAGARRLFAFFALPHRKQATVAAMGALLALNWILFMGALQLVDVAVAVLLAYCGPILVAALTPLVMRESFDRRVIAPLLIGLTGTTIIIAPKGLDIAGETQMLGAGMAFASALTYAALILNTKRLLKGIPVTVYMLGQYVAATILLLPTVFLLDGPSAPIEWGALLVLGVVHTALTGLLFLSGLRKVRPDHAAIITYAEPLSAVVFAAAFLGEGLTVYVAIGGLAIVVGGIMVAKMRSEATVEGPPLLLDQPEETEPVRENTSYKPHSKPKDGGES